MIARYRDGKIICECGGLNRRSYFCEGYWESDYYFDFTLD